MNPFHHGNPVTTPNFLGRKKALSRISHRIYSSQSIAIVSEPRMGKSSLLLHFAKPENHPDLHNGEQQIQRFFSFLQVLAFNDQINQSVFWTLALSPLFSAIIQPHPQSKLAYLYQSCQNNCFNHHSLALLLDELTHQHLHLILLLDEFDVLLSLPGLCGSSFLGSLRSLGSINPSLSLVIASQQSITHLNSLATIDINSTGSPFFNIFEECVLSPFTEEEAELLLSRANGRFSPDDKAFIIHAAGTQPYLLQVIAAELWHLYEDGDVTDPDERRTLAAQVLQDTAADTLKNTWSAWSPQTRMAITVVALANNPQLLENRLFNDGVLLRDLRDYNPELRALEKHGYIKKSLAPHNGGWQIIPAVFQWWLADELVRTVRSDQAFAQWIQAQEWEGLLTKENKSQLLTAAKYLADFVLKNGLINKLLS